MIAIRSQFAFPLMQKLKELQERGKDITIRMIVIYTADVEHSQTSDVMDTGCLRLVTNSAYLSELNSKDIINRLEHKIENQLPLEEKELMEFIVLPLTYKGNEGKNEGIKSAIRMASKILDDEIKVFLLSGVAVFADKVIKKEDAAKTLNCSLEELKKMGASLMQLS